MSKNGLVIVLSGPSGVGKGSVTRKLVNSCKNLDLTTSVTTRDPRPMEVDGVDYYFSSKEDFEQKIDNNEFIEYACVHGNFYGTLITEVQKHTEKGNDVILEIDVQGGRMVRKQMPGCISIFVLPPNLEELKKRLIGRGTDQQEVIEKRLNTAIQEMQQVEDYDYVVVNDDLQDCMCKIKTIIKSEKFRVERNGQLVNELLDGGNIQ